MLKNKGKKNIVRWIPVLFVLAGLFVFCYYLHPQVILDYDDWSYVSYSRIPIPWPTFWNPTRVLPELLMPLCGGFGALLYRVFPAMGYIRAETLSFALMLTFMLFGYTGSFFNMLRRKFGCSTLHAAMATALFFLLHFLAFRTAEEGNDHLFRTANLTCCCFYLVPVLWNAMAVMLFSSEPELYGAFSGRGAVGRKIIASLLVYFAVFSNLYAGVLLAVFAGFRLLEAILKKCVRNTRKAVSGSKTVPAILREHSVSVLILLLWVISLLFEVMGGRAGLADSELSFAEKLRDVLRGFSTVPGSLNLLFGALFVILPVWTIVSVCKKKKDNHCPVTEAENQTDDVRSDKINRRTEPETQCAAAVAELFVAAILIAVYICLLSAKVDTTYIRRPEVLISVFSPILASISVSFAYLLKNTKRSLVWGALLLVLVYVCTDTPGRTFAESYGIDAVITPETCIAVSQDVVDQVIAAEQAGQSHLTIDVSFNGDYCENWPQCTYLQEALIPTLLKHGVIKTVIEADIFPSMEFNAKYNLDFPLLRESTS